MLGPVNRSQAAYDRARSLAEKYNLDFDSSYWQVTPTADRVHKPIRIRIHRSCHRCKTTFGVSKVCVSCDHTRCAECPRYPLKKARKEEVEGLGKGKAIEVSPPFAQLADPVGPTDTVDQTNPGKKKERYVLTIPSKTGGQDLVRKKPRQRVRRTCHSCATVFQSSDKLCASCGHVRCSDCPREPYVDVFILDNSAKPLLTHISVQKDTSIPMAIQAMNLPP